MVTLSRARIVAAVLAALAAGGCAATSPAPPGASLDAVPADFAMDLAVIQTQGAGPADRPPIARCVVFADASLYAEPDGGMPARGARLLPPYRRTLTISQLDSLWALCRDLGAESARDEGESEAGGAREQERPAVTTCTVVITAEGERRAWVEKLSGGERPGAALAALLERAADLAWVEAGEAGGPRRYDFGPDPYARYRRP